MNFESIIFLGLGFNQLEYIQAAKNLGYHIIGFDGDKNAVCKNICDVTYCIRIDEHLKIADQLKVHKNLVGCVSEQTDSALRTVGVINSMFNLSGPTQDVVKFIKNKSYQRIKCRELKINQPNFISYNVKQNFLKEVGPFIKHYKKFVIKPVEGQSSIGVTPISREEILNCNVFNS